MAHIVDIFLQKMVCSHDRGYGMVFFNYCELAITLFFTVSTYPTIADPTENLSIRLYGVLCLLIEVHIFAFIAVRIYHQSQHRDMYQRSQGVEIPGNYRRKIATVIKHYFIISNVFVAVSVLYTILLDWVRIGDPFTFPFIDVLPIKTTNVTVYVCKYIVYALPVYFAHLETCFLNVTFMYSAGVVKRHFQILDEQVEEAVVNEDEQKLKIAIKHHQQVLKYFEDMKTVNEKSILVTIEFCGLYVGLTSCFVIQVMQGFIHQIILGLCIVSSMACLMTIIIYCIYASNMYDLHNGILNALFEHRSCYSRNKSFKRLILIMMTRATIPLEFKAGSVFTINLNLLVKILKFAYTVFNVLLSSINRQFKETRM
ncbi:odorant receptor 43b [Acyrthosiphon pisum]|uniref:Odorant receptor n=1 Tax=Acyrthosiphon pisum TaxID=7029 RepID=A0A8R2H9K0_ACYPI|nr:odorant receptor 43b [Acyrthosiphon pisum]|eukprot:XP_016660447.1 PREDICTED: odorant receptor 43b-like isoform X2 [Acyrthosiphon pisum]